MTARLASFVALMRGEFTQQAEAAALFLPDRAVPAPGAKSVHPDLAGACRPLRLQGGPAFIAIAGELARFSREAGGFFRGVDLEQRRASWGATR